MAANIPAILGGLVHPIHDIPMTFWFIKDGNGDSLKKDGDLERERERESVCVCVGIYKYTHVNFMYATLWQRNVMSCDVMLCYVVLFYRILS